MTYELSYSDAVLLWDAILDLDLSANPLVRQLPVSAGKNDQEEMTMRDMYASHEYDPQPCDECGTVWDTEAQAWECSHGDRMAASDA